MSNTSLTPELVKITTELANAFAQCQKVVSAKARIGLFYQNPEATDLFRKVNEYGEKLRNKHMEGMPPSEEEISAFDELRQNVIDNPVCRGFLEARQEVEEMLAVVHQYLSIAFEKGSAPSDEEVAAAMTQQMSCSCGGGCSGNCDECESDCRQQEAEQHECKCGHHGDGECCGGHGDGECCGRHGEGECCGRHGEGECCGGHGDGHECKCGKH